MRFRNVQAFLFGGAALCLLAGASPAAPASAGASPDMVDTPSGPVPGPVTLAAALKRFPLNESKETARQLLPHWALPKKMVVIVDRPARTAWLQAAMPPGVKVVGVPSDAAAHEQLSDAYAFVLANGDCGVAHGKGTLDMFKGDPHLEWVHSASGGTDQCLVSPALKNGSILLTNSQKVKSAGLAENAYGFIFALARNMDTAAANTRAGSFDAVRATRPPMSLAGATMLIVGLGGAGTAIAHIASDLGMTVIATRHSGHQGPPFVQYVGVANELPNLIGRADIVVIAAPLTPETRGLFNAKMFARMKHGAMLVDFTRAGIVVPDDLAAALKSGQVGSAGLDWASDEPLPANSPLWSAPNLILTGSRANQRTAAAPSDHRAINPQQRRDNELRWVLVRENMRRFATGEKMFSVFNTRRGY